MKQYFTISPGGWGSIHARSFSETDNGYVSHNKDSVTYHESYEDQWGSEYERNVEYSRSFEKVRNNLLNSHKQHVAELLMEIEVLESSNNYEQYRDNLLKMTKAAQEKRNNKQ